MSRVANNPVNLPKGVDVKVEGTNLSVKGGKGALDMALVEGVDVNVDEGMATITFDGDAQRAMAGTTRSLLGTNWKWAIGDGIGFEGSAAIENNIEDFQQYFAIVEFKVNVALKAMENLNLYVSVRDEYNSDPGPGDSWNSLWVTMGFTYGF